MDKEFALEEVIVCSFVDTVFRINRSRVENLHKFMKLEKIEVNIGDAPSACQS